ncbi:MAG: sigma 54-interacting transcriptional regulator [Paracoccaceae bacterium]
MTSQHAPSDLPATETTGKVPIELIGDGVLVLSASGTIIEANRVAHNLLHLDNLVDRPLISLIDSVELIAALSAGRQTEVGLRLAGGRQVVARLRKAPGDPHVSLVLLQDTGAFDHARDRAFGAKPDDTLRMLTAKQARPDFATQRRLSEDFNRVLTQGELAIRQGARVMISGESGVGKSEIARFLHLSQANAHDPFVVVNCASGSSDLPLDVMLFGRQTADGHSQPGLLAMAEGGTLFLDEVSEIPMPIQARLLSLLEDGNGLRRDMPRALAGIGPVNIRIISASNRNLVQAVREGKFRADLYFRLAVVTLNVPPLRDMPPLVGHLTDRFLQKINQRRTQPLVFPDRLRQILADYSFPGNIRELLNIIQRVSVFLEAGENVDTILSELLVPIDVPGSEGQDDLRFGATLDLKSEVRRFERALIDKAIRIHGSKRKAAIALGTTIGTVVRKTTEGPEEGQD